MQTECLFQHKSVHGIHVVSAKMKNVIRISSECLHLELGEHSDSSSEMTSDMMQVTAAAMRIRPICLSKIPCAQANSHKRWEMLSTASFDGQDYKLYILYHEGNLI